MSKAVATAECASMLLAIQLVDKQFAWPGFHHHELANLVNEFSKLTGHNAC